MKVKTFNRSFVFLVLALFFGSAASSQTVPEQLEALFTSPQYPVNGNVLVAENSKVIYRRSFGFADAKNKLPNKEDSRFQLASITKIFTSTAVLQLRDRGRLNLDDPLNKFFPEFPYPDITIRHLLSHTSGLPDFQIFEELVEKDPSKIFTNSDIITALKAWKEPLSSRPGDSWSYSNPGYCLLALLVEKLSGLKFEDYVRQQIFLPTGMANSYFETDKLPTTDLNKAKEQRYRLLFDTELQAVEMEKWRGFTGNGGIISTVGDLLKFDQALSSGKLLKDSTLEEAFSPVRLNNGKSVKTTTLDASYGLGWFIFEDESGGKIVWHGGGRPGIVTVFLRNVSKRQTAIVLDNSYNLETYRIGLNAINIVNGKPALIRRKSLVREYGLSLVEKGADAAICKLVELRSDDKKYFLDEDEMNDLALQLLYAGKSANHNELALEVAKLNIAFFPDSFNVYDSYGEILAKIGRKDLAISMYRKSVVLNPKNEGGKRALVELLKK